jgi:hypothetical protein
VPAATCRLPQRVHIPLQPAPLPQPRPGVLPAARASRRHDPVRYHDLIASQRPGAAALEPPRTRGHPLSPGRPRANRPWRAAEPQLLLPYSGYMDTPDACYAGDRGAARLDPGASRSPP